MTSFDSYSKSREAYLLLLYVAVAIIFFCVVLLNRRNYQDVWILDGIVVPTAVFVCFSVVVEMLLRRTGKVVVLAALFLFSVALIPGLKYELFCGCFDPPRHYEFTRVTASLGSIPEKESYSESYMGNPGMHVLLSCISIVSGISVNGVFKFVFPAILAIVPFIIYFITKGLLPSNKQKYAIIASSFPVIRAYLVFGTTIGLIPYMLLLAIFLRGMLTKHGRKFWLLFPILGFNLIISHAVAAFFALFLLIGTPLIFKILSVVKRKTSTAILSRFPALTSSVPPLLYLVLLVTWWANISTFNLETLTGYVKTLFTGGTMITPVPERFFQVPILAELQVLTVLHLAYFMMIVLSLFAVVIFLKKSRQNKLPNETQTIYFLLINLSGIVALFLSFQFASGFGELSYGRFISYAIPLCVPLVGLTLEQLNEFLGQIPLKVVQNIGFTLVLSVLVLACLIQFFPYQPLIPKADVLSKNLPKNEFIVDLGSVNTQYQKEMISFAERHSSNQRVLADTVTRCQTYGFSNYSFFSRVMWPSPLSQYVEGDMIMLHTSQAGPFAEKVEYRTSERIENFRLGGSVIYDNGGSFILSFVFSQRDASG